MQNLSLTCACFVAALAFFPSPALRAAGTDSKPIDPRLLERFEARVHKEPSGHALNYRLFKPQPLAPGTNYPLVLFLHGAAGLGDDNARQFNGGNEVPPLALTTEAAQARFPHYVLVPQCPRGQSWSSYSDGVSVPLRLTMDVVKSLPREFPIDPRRLYVVGVSMGGRGVWETLLRYPNVFAAAVPICAAGDAVGINKLKDLPIWCFHGAADTTVPVDYARKAMEALRKAGGHPKYTEYPGVGHDSYRNAFQEPELLPWLFAQHK